MIFSASFAALLLAPAVFGHASLNPPVSPASYYTTAVRVPHGCNGTATTDVTVVIPENVTSVKARRVNGWTLSTQLRPLAVPLVSEGGSQINTTVANVTWSNGNLPDSDFEDFELTMRLPASADGTKIYFSVIQKCIQGWNNWTQVPTDGSDQRYPAPAVTIFANNTLLKLNASLLGLNGSSQGGSANSKNGAEGLFIGTGSVLALTAIASSFLFL